MVTLASSTPGSAPKPIQVSNAGLETHLRDVQWYLCQKLQKSLNLKELLGEFFATVQSFAGVEGLEYGFDEARIRHRFGEQTMHNAQYRISAANQHLGAVSFRRSTRFAEPELLALEILVGTLFYPLRNALLYREALELSMRDPLTGVGNRMALSQALKRELEVAKRYQRPFCLMLIDADHFKAINDTIGHSAGDTVLQHLVDKISSSLRQIDEVFRYGGEEFVVLLSNTVGDAASMVAERIRQSLMRAPLTVEGETLDLTVSIGLSTYQPGDSEDSLFDRADQALYQAKGNGRNRVEVASE